MTDQTHILIVDDNASLCQTLSLILEHKGYAVATAQDGLQAVEHVKEKPFDLTLLDIKMTPIHGVETYRRIKKIRPEAVVIMMTAYTVEDLVQKALQAGAHGVVYKPLDIKKVIELIEKMTGEQDRDRGKG